MDLGIELGMNEKCRCLGPTPDPELLQDILWKKHSTLGTMRPWMRSFTCVERSPRLHPCLYACLLPAPPLRWWSPALQIFEYWLGVLLWLMECGRNDGMLFLSYLVPSLSPSLVSFFNFSELSHNHDTHWTNLPEDENPRGREPSHCSRGSPRPASPQAICWRTKRREWAQVSLVGLDPSRRHEANLRSCELKPMGVALSYWVLWLFVIQNHHGNGVQDGNSIIVQF